MTEAEFAATLKGEELKSYQACQFKHTAYQPTEKEFSCPKCKAKCGDFCIDEGPNMECPALHVDDILNCYGKEVNCGYGVSAKAFVTNLVKKQNLVACTHCKGKGFVPKKG